MKLEIIDMLKYVGDMVSFSVVITTLLGWLPPLASLATILWIGFQFYHSEPMKLKRKEKKEQRRRKDDYEL